MKFQVYQPSDKKIQDFWVDFNLGSKSISLFIEEKNNKGNYKVCSRFTKVNIFCFPYLLKQVWPLIKHCPRIRTALGSKKLISGTVL